MLKNQRDHADLLFRVADVPGRIVPGQDGPGYPRHLRPEGCRLKTEWSVSTINARWSFRRPSPFRRTNEGRKYPCLVWQAENSRFKMRPLFPRNSTCFPLFRHPRPCENISTLLMRDADSSRINAKPIRARHVFVCKAANALIYMRKA